MKFWIIWPNPGEGWEGSGPFDSYEDAVQSHVDLFGEPPGTDGFLIVTEASA
jgi:hypothetical protein